MDYKFDYYAAIQQLKDMAMIDLMTVFAPDDASKKLIRDAMFIFVKNGVPADTAIKIASELGNIFNKKENE